MGTALEYLAIGALGLSFGFIVGYFILVPILVPILVGVAHAIVLG